MEFRHCVSSLAMGTPSVRTSEPPQQVDCPCLLAQPAPPAVGQVAVCPTGFPGKVKGL